MFRIFSKNKTITEQRNLWLFALEKMVNIALVKVERGDNETVSDIIKEFGKIFNQFLKLKKDNPEKFDSLLWSADFFNRYVVPINKNQSAEIDGKTKSVEDLKKEAGLLLGFTPDRELRGLTQFLDSYKKIYEAAIKNSNYEISRYVVYNLNSLLAEISQEPDNQLFVEQFLRLTSSMAYKAIKESGDSNTIGPSIYSLAINWYTDIVFNGLRRSTTKDFNLSYLSIFNNYFLSIIRYIISEGRTFLFHSLVSTLVDGVHISDYNEGKVWNYTHLLLESDTKKYNEVNQKHDIQKQATELTDSEKDINSQEELKAWLESFENLKRIVEPNIGESQKQSAQKIEEEIIDFVTLQLKYKNLLEVVFAIGIYSLFKQKYSYIKYLWEYKQPLDSDASWLGHDVNPRTLNDVIKSYFKENPSNKNMDFWEGHHGSEKYNKQYFLLLLLRALKGFSVDGAGGCQEVENYSLPKLHIHNLSNIEYSIDGLVVMANDLKQDVNLLSEIGFDRSKIDELFDKKLVPFLKSVKEEATKQISTKHKEITISQTKVKEFKKEVMDSFYTGAILRDIFINYLESYDNKIEEKIPGKKERFGVNIVDDKAAFFDEWNVSFGRWGENYGHDLSSGENSYLLDDIARNCKEIPRESFESTLLSFEDPANIVIFATGTAIWQFLEDSKKYRPKWNKDIKQLTIEGFDGWYDLNGQLVPVFKTYHQRVDKQVLIFNKEKMGKLIQLSPLNGSENEKFIEDIFYMDIQAFSENSELMEFFIKSPPTWLKEIGDEKEQREHLKERVRIHLFERFEYEKPENFEGYKVLF